ncbi:MAG: sugar transferase [Gemmataceae bacterium]|nr:sugar transferase [Gemmataceae bacterium]
MPIMDTRGMESSERGCRPTRRRKRRSPEGPATEDVAQPRGGASAPAKRAVEFAGALVLLVLTGPLILLAALLVRLTSRGPAFYTQTRVGLGGKPFTIYKLRTMIDNCESLTGPRWAIPGDPRITWLGHFLRVSHLDELPQLLNVLKGDMSLVGPRPERPEFVGELERALPGYRERLAVRPGVTGLAQVQLAADTDLTSVRRKLMHDLYYIREGGLWLDFRILCCTACRMLGIPFRISGWVLGIPTHEAIDEAMNPTLPEAPAVRVRKAAA